jgi:hypothetical protein
MYAKEMNTNRTISNKSEENQLTKFPGNSLIITQKEKERLIDHCRNEEVSLSILGNGTDQKAPFLLTVIINIFILV